MCRNRSSKAQGIAGLQGEKSVAVKFSFDGIRACHPFGRVCMSHKTVFRYFNGKVALTRIHHLIQFHQSRKFCRRQIFAGQLPLSVITLIERTLYRKHSFQRNIFYFLVGKAASVYRDAAQRIPIVTTHQAGMGIVGDGAQQRPYHAFIQCESSVAIHSVSQYHRYLFAAHFNMVFVRNLPVNCPHDFIIRCNMPTWRFISRPV